MRTTTAFGKITKSIGKETKIAVVQGGTSAGKTFAILQFLIIAALHEKIGGVVSIVSESMPHLRRGAMRDFFKILKGLNVYRQVDHNKSSSSYRLNNTLFEFFGADKDDKLRGARRNILFVNEANNITFDAWSELFIRTRKFAIIDFNPVSEFWAHTEILNHPDETFRELVSFVKLNYQHNEALDAATIQNIEARKHDKSWFEVYGLGNVGVPQGVIFPSSTWSIGELPENAKYICSGMDFGDSAPTTLIDIYQHDGVDYYDEIIYQPGTDANKLIHGVRANGISRMIVADPSHETIIKMLANMGVMIMGVKKYRGSVEGGLQMMKTRPFVVTKRSLNLIKELRNYVYEKTRSGIMLDTPRKYMDHAIDAARYAKLHSSRSFSVK